MDRDTKIEEDVIVCLAKGHGRRWWRLYLRNKLYLDLRGSAFSFSLYSFNLPKNKFAAILARKSKFTTSGELRGFTYRANTGNRQPTSFQIEGHTRLVLPSLVLTVSNVIQIRFFQNLAQVLFPYACRLPENISYLLCLFLQNRVIRPDRVACTQLCVIEGS